eukprot:TRINITY_DN12844_c0_g1_i2.p2 TRINITY_DN12844_c0_g1~~TRINITY_DN12844_c0_g1_i2.p2  ORF type:complete len:142 (+),score=31.33 TRINITY_DN12844_c0_g1_i2:52-477(+)
MALIDCHAHLTQPVFQNDVWDVLSRAKDRGVVCVVDVVEFVEDAERLIRICRQQREGSIEYANISPCFGVHPVQVGPSWTDTPRCIEMDDVVRMEKLVNQHHASLVGIGEIGLDFSSQSMSTPDAKEKQENAIPTKLGFEI